MFTQLNFPLNSLQNLAMNLVQTQTWQSKQIVKPCLIGPSNIGRELVMCLDCQMKCVEEWINEVSVYENSYKWHYFSAWKGKTDNEVTEYVYLHLAAI
jgi:hypothetical protein